jgi:ribose/xylose/arabinose/galactoside ABC-type transport system permease subunit
MKWIIAVLLTLVVGICCGSALGWVIWSVHQELIGATP